MTGNRTRVVAAVFAVLALATGALAQGNLRERIHYAINVPQALEMSGYVLPAGKYLIRQVNATDPNLFALHRGDDTNTPIATIRTTRVDYQPGDYPQDAKIRLEIDEASVGFMATLPLPASLGHTPEDAARLRDALLFEDHIEIQLHAGHGRLWARVSAQVYNDGDDIEKLGAAVSARAGSASSRHPAAALSPAPDEA